MYYFLEELDFFYGSKLAKAESHLDKVLEGREIQAHSVEQVKQLIQELQQMSSFAQQ